MKFLDKISEALGLYEEEEELIEESVNEELEEKPKKSFFSRKLAAEKPAAPVKQPEPERKPLFKQKPAAAPKPASKTISIPMAQKQVKVVVLEPVSFDDSQKIADYLNGSQPVVVNFEATDKVIMKRMTDFISGVVYALGGSMKKIGHNILVCAPKNVDINADDNIYDERGGQPWKKYADDNIYDERGGQPWKK